MKIESTQREKISSFLFKSICEGRYKAGESIPPLRKLARDFGTSTFPVRQAVSQLEKRGLLVRRHGSGVYVAANIPKMDFCDAVALVLDASGHIFGDLCRLLANNLRSQNRVALTLPWGNPETRQTMEQAARSGTRFFIVRGEHFFPFGWFTEGPLSQAHLIAVLVCDCFVPEMKVHRAIVDHAAAGRNVAEHLLANGHRGLLVIGTPDMLEAAETRTVALAAFGHELLRTWRESHRPLQMLPSVRDAAGEYQVNVVQLLGILRSAGAPTAIVGLRDFDAWQAQDAIRRAAPELLPRLEIFGYGDTPWSRAAQPPFSTVNWNLEEIAAKACDIVQTLQRDPQAPAMSFTVNARLVLRPEASNT
ncbi:MAG: GntR family transcriptional regulator [Planctomycetota bacterium]|nr:GntR family transcriptional regulator [Planctomycetota bacterium]